MTTQQFVEVATDFECNPEDFWNAIHRLKGEGNPLAKIVLNDRIVVTGEEAEEIKSFVESIDGWDDPQNPEHAPYPVIFNNVETDFREAGYDSFSTDDGPEESDSFSPSEYGDFPEISDAAREAARQLYDEGYSQNQTEYRDRCESLESAISDLFTSANDGPLRGESNSLMECVLIGKVYSVQVTKYFPAVYLDWRRLWDGAEDGEQNPDDSDGTLETDLQAFVDDSENNDETREAVRTVLTNLRAIESEYSDKGYAAPVQPVTE